MSEFVEECRRHWRRLRVPDAVAAEMAEELSADLADAEAEGITPAEVLGTAALDPRWFAESWAAERGAVPGSPPRRRLVPTVLTVLLAVGLTGATLAIFARSSPTAGKPVAVVLPAPTTGRIGVWITPSDGRFASGTTSSRTTAQVVGVCLVIAALGGAVSVLAVSLPIGRRASLRF
jgi:hypothetical protein